MVEKQLLNYYLKIFDPYPSLLRIAWKHETLKVENKCFAITAGHKDANNACRRCGCVINDSDEKYCEKCEFAFRINSD